MDEKIDQLKGAIKEKAGQVTGDEQMEQDGKLDQAKGKVKEALNDAKDAIRKIGN